VPEGGDEGADKGMQYVDVAQDLDQVQKGPRTTLPVKASPRSLTLSFKNYAIVPCYACAFTFQELFETLDA
jgi:hypothetical protein